MRRSFRGGTLVALLLVLAASTAVAAPAAKRPAKAPYTAYLAKTAPLVRAASAEEARLMQLAATASLGNVTGYGARLRTSQDVYARLATRFAAVKAPRPLGAAHAKQVRSLRGFSTALGRASELLDAYAASGNTEAFLAAAAALAKPVDDAVALRRAWAVAVRAQLRRVGVRVPAWLAQIK